MTRQVQHPRLQGQITTLTKEDLQKILTNPWTEPAAIKFYRKYENEEINSSKLIQELERLKEMIEKEVAY